MNIHLILISCLLPTGLAFSDNLPIEPKGVSPVSGVAEAKAPEKEAGELKYWQDIDGTLFTFMLDHACPGGSRFTVVPLKENGKNIGKRYVFEGGKNMAELPSKNGKMHGVMRYWSQAGVLLAEIPFVDGRLHGVSRFYDYEGQLLGTSEFNEGTGTYRVWGTRGDRAVFTERYYVDGVVTKHQLKNAGIPLENNAENKAEMPTPRKPSD